MENYNIMAIVISHRSKNAPEVQKILTKFGCMIKVRLGLHEAGNVCSEEGLIILQLDGDSSQIKSFQEELNSMEGVRANTMVV
jgi:metal-responsive CopG/Arc/MetJ family transcriptional regulator